MSFTLTVDADPWRAHLARTRDAIEQHAATSLVPVVKANGYGLGQSIATRAAEGLGAEVLATGTVFEIDEVLASGLGEVLVLERFDPLDTAAARAWDRVRDRWDARRVIRTIATLAGLRAMLEGPAGHRIVLEGRTSMHRFGFSPDELLWVLAEPDVRQAIATGHIEILGLALHLPLTQPPGSGSGERTPRAQEALQWCGLWEAQESLPIPALQVWVSHVSDAELQAIRAVTPLPLRVRAGTRLWLGNRDALTARGSVLAVHPLPTGTRVGYRQRSGPRDGTLVVVSGGTAHGIGLSAPSPAASVRQRATTAGIGALDAAGRALSPFTWQGRQRWFAEPPHQHHSMIWLPRGCMIPAVGDELVADVRFTTSRFDAVLGID